MIKFELHNQTQVCNSIPGSQLNSIKLKYWSKLKLYNQIPEIIV